MVKLLSLMNMYRTLVYRTSTRLRFMNMSDLGAIHVLHNAMWGGSGEGVSFPGIFYEGVQFNVSY